MFRGGWKRSLQKSGCQQLLKRASTALSEPTSQCTMTDVCQKWHCWSHDAWCALCCFERQFPLESHYVAYMLKYTKACWLVMRCLVDNMICFTGVMTTSTSCIGWIQINTPQNDCDRIWWIYSETNTMKLMTGHCSASENGSTFCLVPMPVLDVVFKLYDHNYEEASLLVCCFIIWYCSKFACYCA